MAAGVILIDPPFLARWMSDAPDADPAESVAFAQGSDSGDASPGGRLSVAADSVARSLLIYRQRHTDFAEGRLSCAGLTAGYARLGEHVVALARARADIERPSPAQDSVFETAIDAAAEADRLFAAAGCPRP